jgi:hypothetical protein
LSGDTLRDHHLRSNHAWDHLLGNLLHHLIYG